MSAARTLRVFCLSLGLLVPVLWQPAVARVFDPETFNLPNGLQVVVISNKRAPVVTHMVWYRIGAADEKPGKSGIAHFLEHLMFKGTPDIPPGEYSKIIARNGGRDNAFTSYDYTGYFQNVARDRLELVMRMEADRMSNLVLTDEVVDPEREVIIEERRSVVDNRPASRLREQMQAALYLNHPYQRPVIGWLHEMRGLTRQDAIDWYKTYYTPNNAILIVAGDITVAELKPLAEKYYGPIPSRAIPERVRPQEPPPQAARRLELKDPRVQQPALSRMYLAPSYTSAGKEHAYALQVLADLLGGGATSRLYRSLVLEKNVAAGAGSYYDPDTFDQTSFSFSVTPRNGIAMGDVEAALDAVIAKLVADGVSAEELDRTKARMRAAAVLARDSLQSGARVIGTALTTGQTIEDVESWPERIDAVTKDDVDRAARYLLQPDRSVTGLLLPKPSS
jgi:zinc protease